VSEVSWPLEGEYGKDFRTTSSFGWRIHPIRRVRAHHNGEDLVHRESDAPVLAIYDGVVTEARPAKGRYQNGEPKGYGYFVAVRHKINGKFYVALYAHLVKNSFMVRKGQRVKAGQPLGIMGTSGASTGIHLHFEIHEGKKFGWSSNGVGFLDPIPFLETLGDLVFEQDKAQEPADPNGPTGDAPVHSFTPPKPEAVSAPKSKPNLEAWLRVGSNNEQVAYLQKQLGITVDGIFGPQTKKAVLKFQREKGIAVDGIVGPQTWALVPSGPKRKLKKPEYPGILRKGSKGTDVKYVQRVLGITADGIFGPQTQRSVKEFQRSQKVKVDGIVGPVTWGLL